MRRARAVALGCLLAVAACSPFGRDGQPADPLAALRRFVAAWPVGGAKLAATVTGADANRLVDSLRALRAGGVVRATLADASRTDAGANSFTGTVQLHFADRARLELEIRAVVDDGRVRARPPAVSTRLDDWEPLRVEEVGAVPVRGDILSRSGTLVARGPESARVVARPGLAPAVALVDAALDARLGGRRGRRLVAGKRPRVLAESAAADGEHVSTSLDDAAQAAAEESLGRTPGAVVVVDPRTAGIRALVSNPEPEQPDRSPATAGYSPGSAFKLVTAAAALEASVLDTDDVVPCPARISMGERFITNFESIAYGPITFEKAFAVSCNTAFAQVGASVGTARLLRTAERLGFRVAPELDGPGTVSVPRSRGELGVWSFGAAGSLVSPVQLAGIGSTIARGGRSVTPGWTDDTGAGPRALRPRTAAALVTMMEEVVRSGTGVGAAVPGAQIAGKTGTADPREPGARPDAWFVGLAPSRDARVVAVAFLPEAGLGGELAASMVRKLLIATRSAWMPH